MALRALNSPFPIGYAAGVPKSPDPFEVLESASEKYESAKHSLDDARMTLTQAIKSARKTGLTLQQIADITGLTPMRISQIARDK